MQKGRVHLNTWSRLLIVIAVLIPLAVLFLVPGLPAFSSTFLFWLVLLLCFWLILAMVGTQDSTKFDTAPAGPRMLHEEEQPEVVRDVMKVQVATEEPTGERIFRGRLRESASGAFERLKRTSGRETVPMLQEDDQLEASIVLMPRPVEQAALEREVRPLVNWLLFGLTVITTTWAGAAHQGVDLIREPGRFAVGLPYSLALLAILGIHELGHYFTAKRHGIRVTPPYFIPVPFALGTFGAFIQMRSPVENRRALFDVAVAGPLAGLVVAIPALLIGLRFSQVIPGDVPADSMHAGTSVGSSLLFALLAKLSIGDTLQSGHVIRLSALAFAGWLGLFITALNLLPVGQLDGGHIAHALFGRRAGDTVGTVAMWSLLLLAIFVWPGLTLWAVVVFFLAGRTIPPLNDLTPLTPGRRWLGFATFVILGLILAPLPHSFWPAVGIHCPYV